MINCKVIVGQASGNGQWTKNTSLFSSASLHLKNGAFVYAE